MIRHQLHPKTMISWYVTENCDDARHTSSSESPSIASNIVWENDWPHRCLAGATFAHQKNLKWSMVKPSDSPSMHGFSGVAGLNGLGLCFMKYLFLHVARWQEEEKTRGAISHDPPKKWLCTRVINKLVLIKLAGIRYCRAWWNQKR